MIETAMEKIPEFSEGDAQATSLGSIPEIKVSTMEPENRSVESVSQAISVSEAMIEDWRDGIRKTAVITAKLNGERPYNQKKLKDAGKGWKSNISTGFLSTECAKVIPRLFMPIKSAKYITAASLPPGHPNGLEKSELFRQAVTDVIRGWPKFNFYLRGLAREVGVFGFAFNVFFDEYDWRPTLIRQDRGFVPKGTEILEEPAFFMAKYDYRPDELLSLLKTSVDSGRTEWDKGNVVSAIGASGAVQADAKDENSRSYEELVRQSSRSSSYRKGARFIQTWHLWAKEASGKVSHYIILADVQPTGQSMKKVKDDGRLLYENLDQYDSMFDVVNPIVFDFGDGTIHGSWGAAHHLNDMASQVEKIRCDSIDNLRMSNKIKVKVAEGKNVGDVQLQVNDTVMMVAGAEWSGNTAAMVPNPQGYDLLDQKLSQIAQQKIGAFVPDIPLQQNDIKAAHVNAKLHEERTLQESLLECFLIQFGYFAKNMQKRLCDPDSPLDEAKSILSELDFLGMTDEEVKYLAEEAPVQSIIEYTEFRARQRADFAAAVLGNPLFNQQTVARTMASSVGDARFVSSIVVAEADQTQTLAAQRQQLMENAALALEQEVPVIPQDLDWIHMQTMKPGLAAAIKSGQIQMAQVGLQHYAAHYEQGIAKKSIPKEFINDEKSLIASMQKNIEAQAQSQQLQQQTQQAGEQGVPDLLPGEQEQPQ